LKAQVVDLQERRRASQRQQRIDAASTALGDAASLLARINELGPLVNTEAERRRILGAMLNLQEVMSVLRRLARDECLP